MSEQENLILSVVVPLHNEADGLLAFNTSLETAAKTAAENYEIIYCDDGSTDDTAGLVKKLRSDNPRIKLIKLSRHFGKESALSAGIAEANGQAILTIDGDGQHPVELIPDFVKKWQGGAQVVVGISTNRKSESTVKRLGSRLFYKTFNLLTGQKLISGMTDYRLIDRAVQKEFVKLSEVDRVTRGLIDWLGFKREYIEYTEKLRTTGTPGYSFSSLVKLATNSFVSLSPTPLYLFGYLGVFITISSFILGVAVFIEQLLLSDPWNWNFTGTAMLGILVLFLVGIVLMSQGILSLYISRIHSQSKQRPLYVIDRSGSLGIKD
ncbi:MAG TPA: glycosyltransferase family 2 protein [Patescibacteria group bacterium]|nr:glycosyltransferase family 2 protein [Patescibacteria group bacterium]